MNLNPNPNPDLLIRASRESRTYDGLSICRPVCRAHHAPGDEMTGSAICTRALKLLGRFRPVCAPAPSSTAKSGAETPQIGAPVIPNQYKPIQHNIIQVIYVYDIQLRPTAFTRFLIPSDIQISHYCCECDRLSD